MNPATGFPVVAIPTPGMTGGRPRRQPLIDTEVIVGGGATAVPIQIPMYNNFGQFSATPNNTGIVVAKVFGRDATMTGTAGQLPQNTYFYWYVWRFKLKTYLTNLNTEANAVVFEQIHRLRKIMNVAFSFQQTQLMNFPLDELPDGVGSEFVQTTYTSTTVLSLPNGVPLRSNGKDVTIAGNPVGIDALQNFGVSLQCAASSGLLPLVDVFPQSVFEGILVQGIVG